MVERLGFPDEVSGVFTTWKKSGRSLLGPRPIFSVRMNSVLVAALKA
jgi:hypothetical protein